MEKNKNGIRTADFGSFKNSKRDIEVIKERTIKTSFHIKENKHTLLKTIAVQNKISIRSLINEAIELIIKKYK